MKATLRKQLRAQRRSLSAAEHARRSKLAAKAVTALAAFNAGKRVALYLPFDRETDTAALIVAARRRGVRIYVPVIVDRRHAACASIRSTARLAAACSASRVPHALRAADPPRWFDLIVVPLVGVDARGPPLRHGRRLLRSGARASAATGIAGAARAWSDSPSIVSAPTRGSPSLGRAPGFARDRIRTAALLDRRGIP